MGYQPVSILAKLLFIVAALFGGCMDIVSVHLPEVESDGVHVQLETEQLKKINQLLGQNIQCEKDGSLALRCRGDNVGFGLKQMKQFDDTQNEMEVWQFEFLTTAEPKDFPWDSRWGKFRMRPVLEVDVAVGRNVKMTFDNTVEKILGILKDDRWSTQRSLKQ